MNHDYDVHTKPARDTSTAAATLGRAQFSSSTGLELRSERRRDELPGDFPRRLWTLPLASARLTAFATSNSSMDIVTPGVGVGFGVAAMSLSSCRGDTCSGSKSGGDAHLSGVASIVASVPAVVAVGPVVAAAIAVAAVVAVSVSVASVSVPVARAVAVRNVLGVV